MKKTNYYRLLLDELKIKRELCLRAVNVQQEKATQYLETIDSLEKAIEKMEE